MKHRSVAIVIGVLCLALVAGPVFAQNITAQALGLRSVNSVTGQGANIWTAQQPGGWYGIASPAGVCTTAPPCSGAFVETGYYIGTRTSPQNVLQQYAAYVNSSGQTVNVFGLGNLNNNAWYSFSVAYNTYSQSPNRWVAFRTGWPVYTFPSLSFTSGNSVACGGEGGDVGVPMGVECSNLKYRSSAGSWINYDYTYAQTYGVGYSYCIAHTSYAYGSISWKCS
jgi:hypothetical protein